MIAKHSKYAAKGGIFNHHVCSVFRRIYPSTTNQNNNKIIIADALFQIQQHALQRIEYTMTYNNQPLSKSNELHAVNLGMLLPEKENDMAICGATYQRQWINQ